eukprot:Tbor_TRINITY_DN3407_c0_g1::TRINITY_DN3407_c0_g1_i1::g.3731::m.3731
MLTSFFGFDGYRCDAAHFPDYYDVLGVPAPAHNKIPMPSEEMLTRKLIERIKALMLIEREEMFDEPPTEIHNTPLHRCEVNTNIKKSLSDKSLVETGGNGLHEGKTTPPVCVPQMKPSSVKSSTDTVIPRDCQQGKRCWATLKIATRASFIVEAHTVLSDSEMSILYRYGGHSALLFLQKVNNRSQSFFLSPFVYFFTFRGAVNVAAGLRLLFFVVFLWTVIMIAIQTDMRIPMDPGEADPYEINTSPNKSTFADSEILYNAKSKMPSRYGAHFATLVSKYIILVPWFFTLIPLFIWILLFNLACLFSVIRLVYLADGGAVVNFLYKRLNGLRLLFPPFILISLILAQRKLDGDPIHFYYSVVFVAIFIIMYSVITIMHIIDTFVHPVTIRKEAEKEIQYTKLFGNIHLSLQSEGATYYWDYVPHTVGNSLHILTYVTDAICGVLYPAAFYAIVMTSYVEIPEKAYNSQGSILISAPFEMSWHYAMSALHCRVIVWAIASVVNEWVQASCAVQRQRCLKYFPEDSVSSNNKQSPLEKNGSPKSLVKKSYDWFEEHLFVISILTSSLQILTIGCIQCFFLYLLACKLENIDFASVFVVCSPIMVLLLIGLISSIISFARGLLLTRTLPGDCHITIRRNK